MTDRLSCQAIPAQYPVTGVSLTPVFAVSAAPGAA